jgi:hypothetical protein
MSRVWLCRNGCFWRFWGCRQGGKLHLESLALGDSVSLVGPETRTKRTPIVQYSAVLHSNKSVENLHLSVAVALTT